MKEVKHNRLYIDMYDNITELCDYITTKKRKEGRDNDSERRGGSWAGTDTFEEAFDLIKYGDLDLYNKIRTEDQKIDVTKFLGNAKRRQRYEKRVYGCIPNVPLYLVGNPVNMISPEMNDISHKIVNIVLSVGVPCGVGKDQITEIGIVYLKVIDLLEKNGYRCNLYAGVTASECGTTQYMLVRIKTDREPLNLKKICFPIAHPSMLRRIYFKWAEVNDAEKDITNYGYGCNDSKTEVVKNIKENFKDDYIVWTYVDIDEKDGSHRIKNIKKVLEELKQQGIKIDL